MKIINCTPHDVAIYDGAGQTVLTIIPKSGFVARIKTPPQMSADPVVLDDGTLVPVVQVQAFEAGIVSGLPVDEDDGQTAIIVGIIGAAQFAAGWSGPVYATDTGPDSVVRNAQGQALGGIKRLQIVRASRD